MSRINRWNERTNASRSGGLSLGLITLGTIGSAEQDGWSVLDYSTLMGLEPLSHETYLIKLAKPVRNLTFSDHVACDEHNHNGQLCVEGDYLIGRGSAH